MKQIKESLNDIVNAFAKLSLAGMLGWFDLKQRYRRSKIGPFWLTLSMGILIGTIGVVFSQLFNSPISDFLPFLAIGIIIWTFISIILTEGCTVFIAAEGMILQLPLPLFTHCMRMLWRNFLMLAHNSIIIPIVLLMFGQTISWTILLVIPGLILLILNLAWMSLVLGVICTRFRDLSQIVASVLQVLFYLTPIIWMPSLIQERTGKILIDGNPFYHLIELVRAPILSEIPTQTSWIVSISLAILGWVFTLFFYGNYKKRIPYWL